MATNKEGRLLVDLDEIYKQAEALITQSEELLSVGIESAFLQELSDVIYKRAKAISLLADSMGNCREQARGNAEDPQVIIDELTGGNK